MVISLIAASFSWLYVQLEDQYDRVIKNSTLNTPVEIAENYVGGEADTNNLFTNQTNVVMMNVSNVFK